MICKRRLICLGLVVFLYFASPIIEGRTIPKQGKNNEKVKPADNTGIPPPPRGSVVSIKKTKPAKKAAKSVKPHRGSDATSGDAIRQGGKKIDALSFITPSYQRKPLYSGYNAPQKPKKSVRKSSIRKVRPIISDKVGLPVSKECFTPRVCDTCSAWCRLDHESDPAASRLTEETLTGLNLRTDGYIQIRQLIPTTPQFTILFWLRLPFYGQFVQEPSAAHVFTIFSYFTGITELQLDFNTENLEFVITFNNQVLAPIAVPDLNQYSLLLFLSSWTHVALTYTAYDSTFTLYLDGSKVDAVPISSGAQYRPFTDSGSSYDTQSGPQLQGGGLFVIGQSIIGTNGNPFEFAPSRGFVGCIYDYTMLSIALEQKELSIVFNNCERLCGDIISWSEQHLFDATGLEIVAYPFDHRCCGTISLENEIKH